MDYNYLVSHLNLGKVNRVENPHVSIGGKGINAGRVISLSGEPVILTGVLGGTNGAAILKTLQAEQRYQLEFLKINGNSRNAVTIMHDDNTHTELVEKGIALSNTDSVRLFEHLSRLLADFPITVICISGSVNSEDPFFYSRLLEFLRYDLGQDFPILMDISGIQLKNVLENKKSAPTFIKPNIHELSELFAKEITSTKEILTALNSNLFDAVDLVMISRGSKGGIIKHNTTFYNVKIPRIPIVNTTGCGDATVGGMAYALSKSYTIEDAIKYAMACGMSNSLFETNGIINKKQVTDFFKAIQLSILE